MKHSIRPSIVLLNGNSVLLMKYVYGGKEVYCLPGGKRDPGERLEEAALRELNEELGLSVEIEDLLFVAETFRGEENEWVLHHIFLGNILSGEPKLRPEHTSAVAVEWVDMDDLDAMNLYPNIGADIRLMFNIGSADRITYLGDIKQTFY